MPTATELAGGTVSIFVEQVSDLAGNMADVVQGGNRGRRLSVIGEFESPDALLHLVPWVCPPIEWANGDGLLLDRDTFLVNIDSQSNEVLYDVLNPTNMDWGDAGVKRIVLQYRTPGVNQWKDNTIALDFAGKRMVSASWDVTAMLDGSFEIRVSADCSNGERHEVSEFIQSHTSVISGVLDRKAPTITSVFSTSQSTSLNEGDIVTVTFDESIICPTSGENALGLDLSQIASAVLKVGDTVLESQFVCNDNVLSLSLTKTGMYNQALLIDPVSLFDPPKPMLVSVGGIYDKSGNLAAMIEAKPLENRVMDGTDKKVEALWEALQRSDPYFSRKAAEMELELHRGRKERAEIAVLAAIGPDKLVAEATLEEVETRYKTSLGAFKTARRIQNAHEDELLRGESWAMNISILFFLLLFFLLWLIQQHRDWKTNKVEPFSSASVPSTFDMQSPRRPTDYFGEILPPLPPTKIISSVEHQEMYNKAVDEYIRVSIPRCLTLCRYVFVPIVLGAIACWVACCLLACICSNN
jgi:hypothetical protein